MMQAESQTAPKPGPQYPKIINHVSKGAEINCTVYSTWSSKWQRRLASSIFSPYSIWTETTDMGCWTWGCHKGWWWVDVKYVIFCLSSDARFNVRLQHLKDPIVLGRDRTVFSMLDPIWQDHVTPFMQAVASWPRMCSKSMMRGEMLHLQTPTRLKRIEGEHWKAMKFYIEEYWSVLGRCLAGAAEDVLLNAPLLNGIRYAACASRVREHKNINIK